MKRFELSDGAITIRPYRKQDAEELHAAIMESVAELKP